VGELLGMLCFYPVDHLNSPVPMASLAHNVHFVLIRRSYLGRMRRIKDSGLHVTRPPRRLGRQQRLRLRRFVLVCGSGSQALSRGVRGAYKCRRCWVFAIFEIVSGAS
jgi:hypothetical protein